VAGPELRSIPGMKYYPAITRSLRLPHGPLDNQLTTACLLRNRFLTPFPPPNQDLLIAGWERHGICAENLQSYIPRNDPISAPSAKAKKEAVALAPIDVLLVKHWTSGVGARDDHLQRVLETLQEQEPLTVTLAWPKGIPTHQNLDKDFMLIEHDESIWDRSGHGTIFVGYEINKRYDGGAVFLFRNTWGPEWGDRGYGKISLALARKLMISAYAVQPRKPEKVSLKKSAA
jgi:hypothetical protein